MAQYETRFYIRSYRIGGMLQWAIYKFYPQHEAAPPERRKPFAICRTLPQAMGHVRKKVRKHSRLMERHRAAN